MRQIVKDPTEPPEFTAWKALANPDWQPSWGNFQRPEKAIVHRALLAEQGYLCCYCGRRIEEAVSEDLTLEPAESHIEHFRPRETFPQHSLDYQNFHASCLKERPKGTPLHCGAAKGNWYDLDLTVSPMQPGVENRFRYDAEGHIHPAEGDAGAQATIEHLHLEEVRTKDGIKASPLVADRSKAIEAALFEDFMQELAPGISYQVQRPKSIAAIQAELARVRTRDAHDRFPSFAQAIESVGRGLVP